MTKAGQCCRFGDIRIFTRTTFGNSRVVCDAALDRLLSGIFRAQPAFMRNLFKKILCPIDFDENSIAALRAARDLALDPQAILYVLHVVRLVLAGFPKRFHAYPMTEQEARSRLGETAREHLEGKVRYELLTRTDDPASAILRAVEELGVDSVVMATHGRTRLGHFLLGSVAERVVRESPRPVLTIRGPAK